MKKLFVIVCAATIMVASTSCKGGVTSDLKSQEDSSEKCGVMASVQK